MGLLHKSSDTKQGSLQTVKNGTKDAGYYRIFVTFLIVIQGTKVTKNNETAKKTCKKRKYFLLCTMSKTQQFYEMRIH